MRRLLVTFGNRLRAALRRISKRSFVIVLTAALLALTTAWFVKWQLELYVSRRLEGALEARSLVGRAANIDVGLTGVALQNLVIQSKEGEAIRATIAHLAVSVGWSGKPRSMKVEAARLELVGSTQELRDAFSRRAGTPEVSDTANKSALDVSLDNSSVSWRDDSTATRLDVTGLSGERRNGATSLRAQRVHATRAPLDTLLVEVLLTAEGSVIQSLHAAEGDVTMALHGEEARPSSIGSGGPAGSAQVPVGQSPPPPAPPEPHNLGPAPTPPGAGPHAAPTSPLPFPTIEPLALRAKASAILRVALAQVPLEVTAAVDSLRWNFASRSQRVVLGPGKFDLRRDPGAVTVGFIAPSSDGRAPIHLSARAPLGDGEFTLDVSGGPIPMRLVDEGGGSGPLETRSATLAGTVRATLGSRLSIDTDLDVAGLSFEHPALASAPLHGLDVRVGIHALIDEKSNLRLSSSEVRLGALRAFVEGSLEHGGDYSHGAVSFSLPVVDCQVALASIPRALVPTLQGTRMRGVFSGHGHLEFDTRNFDALDLKYKFEDGCAFTDVPLHLAKERFTRAFAHRVYSPDGAIVERSTGPGTMAWTLLDDMSPYMAVAVQTTEDGGFFRHRGFNHAAVRGALIADLKARKFVRGASTITMQLAKNVFLGREKTFARKLEEVLLTDYLEQAFTKEEMLEIYLNVIEFGPNVYGIREAADHYFLRTPSELNLAECFFLASILPSPVRYHSMFDKGAISPAWRKHVDQLMQASKRVGFISEAELRDGLASPIEFQRPGQPRPEPRSPVAPERRRVLIDGEVDWQAAP